MGSAWMHNPWSRVWQIGALALCLFIPVYCFTEIIEFDGSDDEDGEVEALPNYQTASTHKRNLKEQSRLLSNTTASSLSDSAPTAGFPLSRWMTAARLRLGRGQHMTLRRHRGCRPQAYLPGAVFRTTSPTTDPA